MEGKEEAEEVKGAGESWALGRKGYGVTGMAGRC